MFYDSSFSSPSGVRVFIEKKAQLTLLGTEMDFVEDKLSSEFLCSINPNIKGTWAVEKALTFDSSGLLGPQETKKPLGLIEETM